MTNIIAIACLLNFAAISAAVIQSMGYEVVSPVSRALCIPLILGGTIAGFMAAFCMIKAEGWIAGLALWFVSGLVVAGVASNIGKRWDGILSMMASASLVAGTAMFWGRFL